MDKTLVDYLLDLATDPQELAKFQQDPDAAMDARGIPPDAKDALKSGDANKINAAIAANLTGVPGTRAMPAITVMIEIIIRF